jgi:predicted Zn-dependent protease
MKNQMLNSILPELFKSLHSDEGCEIYAIGEESHYMRFTHGKVRQSGAVRESTLRMTLFKTTPQGVVKCSKEIQVGTLDPKSLKGSLEAVLYQLRQIQGSLPADPFAVIPQKLESTEQTLRGRLLDPKEISERVLSPAQGDDFVGISASGVVHRGYWNHLGQTNTFSSDSFLVDYSLISSRGKAVTGTYAGSEWADEVYQAKIAEDRLRRGLLERSAPVRLAPGRYRVYLTAQAVNDLLDLISYGSLSEGAIQRRQTWLRHLRTGDRRLSPLISLADDLSHGLVPRFSDGGEVAPDRLSLLKSGALDQALCGKRTEKEFACVSNGASESESPHSLSVSAGTLKEEDVLSELQDGLYLPALHYLNWSDMQDGRMTGMTRHAAFLVKNGKLQSGIEDMRFDESIFNIWGDGLIGIRDETEWCPLNQTYVHREVGGARSAGMLIDGMSFPL